MDAQPQRHLPVDTRRELRAAQQDRHRVLVVTIDAAPRKAHGALNKSMQLFALLVGHGNIRFPAQHPPSIRLYRQFCLLVPSALTGQGAVHSCQHFRVVERGHEIKPPLCMPQKRSRRFREIRFSALTGAWPSSADSSIARGNAAIPLADCYVPIHKLGRHSAAENHHDIL